jgi:hypothetical protein
MKQIHRLTAITLVLLSCFALAVPIASALGSTQNPQSGSVGLEGTVPGNPPTQAATIAVPSNGQVFDKIPITVSGLCKTDLLVKIFSNNVFVGSTTCVGGSYSLKVDLFSGRNDLVARVYDALDQAGPDSNVVTVTFNDAQFAKFGTHVTLTSSYARLGVNPNSVLTWPLILSGGRPPYALSVDWGDGNGADLKSVSFSGVVNVNHTYTQAGVYNIVAKATDANGTSAYLQLVGVANGSIAGGLSTAKGSSTTITKYIILWQFMLVALPLILAAFWLGRRHELYEIRKSIEASREQI